MRYWRPSFLPRLHGAIKWLIIANVVIFFGQVFLGDKFSYIFSLVPYKVLRNFWLWQLLTYMFLHGGFFHLFINLFILWMFGRPIESAWGNKSFLKYYFACGIGASILIILTSSGSKIPTLGASGAIYGILVAYAMSEVFCNLCRNYCIFKWNFRSKDKYFAFWSFRRTFGRVRLFKIWSMEISF